MTSPFIRQLGKSFIQMDKINLHFCKHIAACCRRFFDSRYFFLAFTILPTKQKLNVKIFEDILLAKVLFNSDLSQVAMNFRSTYCMMYSDWPSAMCIKSCQCTSIFIHRQIHTLFIHKLYKKNTLVKFKYHRFFSGISNVVQILIW